MITQCNYKMILGTSLVAHWLGLWASSAGGTGSIPGRGTKILYAGWCGQKNNKKRFYHSIFTKYLQKDEFLNIIEELWGKDGRLNTYTN